MDFLDYIVLGLIAFGLCQIIGKFIIQYKDKDIEIWKLKKEVEQIKSQSH